MLLCCYLLIIYLFQVDCCPKCQVSIPAKSFSPTVYSQSEWAPTSMLRVNIGAPQGYVLSPMLYALHTQDCAPIHDSNFLVKLADDTTVYDHNKTAYRKKILNVTTWCFVNNLAMNSWKTLRKINFQKCSGESILTNNMLVRYRSSSMANKFSNSSAIQGLTKCLCQCKGAGDWCPL